jgi:hypothetical protein
MFINVQHSGDGDPITTNFPADYTGAAGPVPRDATVVITRKDGGVSGRDPRFERVVNSARRTLAPGGGTPERACHGGSGVDGECARGAVVGETDLVEAIGAE